MQSIEEIETICYEAELYRAEEWWDEHTGDYEEDDDGEEEEW